MKYEILNNAGLVAYNGEADSYSDAVAVAEHYKSSFPDDDFAVSPPAYRWAEGRELVDLEE